MRLPQTGPDSRTPGPRTPPAAVIHPILTSRLSALRPMVATLGCAAGAAWLPVPVVTAQAPAGPAAVEPAPADAPMTPESDVRLPDPDAESGRARAPEPGDEVVLVLSDGQRLVGRFVAGGEHSVVVTIGGVDLTVQRGDFERLIVQRPLRDRYREMRSMIDDGDVPRLLLLSEWLRANGLLDEAAAELVHIRKVEPTNVEASRLTQLVDRQRALRETSGRSEPGAARPAPTRTPSRTTERPASAPATGAPPPPADADDAPVKLDPAHESGGIPLLTLDQVNLIKVYEVDLGGSTRFVIDRPVIERLLRDYADSPLIPTTREGKDRFLALPPAEVLNVMFRVQARELYGEVKVLGNPPALKLFRDNVNRGWLVNTCASPSCHGGGSGVSSLELVNRRTTSEQTVYTNFLILERHRLDGDVPLIDYEKPERSPLLQMALPRAESALPHPEVHGWTPAFRTPDDRRFQQAVDWIKAMYRPRPDYPIEYPPGATPGKTFEPVPR